jgi:hypothetical protein
MDLWLSPAFSACAVDDVIVFSGDRIYEVTNRFGSDAARFVGRLNDGASVGEALDHAAAHVLDSAEIESLAKLGVLIESDASAWQGQPLERQMNFWAGLGVADPDGFQARLRSLVVTVVGVGAVGSTVAVHLHANGVGTLRLVDHDEVSESNLARQLFFRKADVGRKKVHVLRECLLARDHAAHVEATPEMLSDVAAFRAAITGSSVVVLAADTPRDAIHVIAAEACAAEGIPLIFGAAGLRSVAWSGVHVPTSIPPAGLPCEPIRAALAQTSEFVAIAVTLEVLAWLLFDGDRPAWHEAAFLEDSTDCTLRIVG